MPEDKSLNDKLRKQEEKKKEEIFFITLSSEGRGRPQITIEGILQKLKPDPSYKGPIFPEDGNITKEWVLDFLEHMKDPDSKISNNGKYIGKF